MLGYCVRCRAKQEMLSATRTLMKNGRRAMIGLCACCGTRMSVMGRWEGEPDLEPGGRPAQTDSDQAASERLTAPTETG